jgi:hypothetical protein
MGIRAIRADRMRGAISVPALAAVVAVVAGVGTGVGLWEAALDTGGASQVVEARRSRVSTARCPEGPFAGTLHGGDRVFATARDASGHWLELRDPHSPNARVWVEARYVEPDGDTADLEVASCEPRGEVTFAQDVTTTTTPSDDDSGNDGSGGGGGGGGGDTTGPSITAVGANPTQIWEQNFAGNPGSCNGDPNLKLQSTVSAQVADPSGVASVTMSWSVATTSASKPMTGGGAYSAILGPFPDTTISGAPAPIAVTITARDGVGNTRTASTSVILNDCVFG